MELKLEPGLLKLVVSLAILLLPVRLSNRGLFIHAMSLQSTSPPRSMTPIKVVYSEEKLRIIPNHKGNISKENRFQEGDKNRMEGEKASKPIIKRNAAALVDVSYASTIEALRAYRQEHGCLVMPRRYIVPNDSSDYPTEWHGSDLSSAVYDMRWWQRHVRSNPDRVAELNELGFVWDRLQPEWNIVLEALITYSSLNNGNVMVPTSFVIPHNDNRWPMATWGIQLGKHVHRIRCRHDFLMGHPDRVHQLNGLQFVWDVSENAFQIFFRALSHFAKMQQYAEQKQRRALRVPSTFVVPSDKSWPQDLWGFPLGAKCSAVRSKLLYVKKSPERRQALESIGFMFSPNSTLGWLEVVHAAAIYSNIHGRELNVPQKFIVPSPPQISHHFNSTHFCSEQFHIQDTWPWPEYLWGLPLGQRLRDVRLKNRYLAGSSAASRIAQLNALGFNWKPKRGRRQQPSALDNNHMESSNL